MDTKDFATVGQIVQGLFDGTKTDQLDDQTPCTEWKVRDLMNHLIGGAHMFAGAFSGQKIDASQMTEMPDLVGDNPSASFKQGAEAFQAAVEAPGALDTMIELPFATLPGSVTLDLAITDVLVHAWDLAKATGQPFDPPADLLARADAFGRAFIQPELRGEGAGHSFAPEVAVPDDASAVDKFVAFAGRQP